MGIRRVPTPNRIAVCVNMTSNQEGDEGAWCPKISRHGERHTQAPCQPRDLDLIGVLPANGNVACAGNAACSGTLIVPTSRAPYPPGCGAMEVGVSEVSERAVEDIREELLLGGF